MKIETSKMEKQIENLPYEQPSLMKYGTMKEITFSTSGSGADAMGKNDKRVFNFNDKPTDVNNSGKFRDRSRHDIDNADTAQDRVIEQNDTD